MLVLNFFSFPVLETERLILRCLDYDDADELLFLRSDQSVLQYLDREPMTCADDIHAFTTKILEELHKNESIFWVICLREDPRKMIGSIGFWRVQKEHYRAEIGYVLHPAHWKKGIMKEAMNAATAYAFTKTALHSIEANINPANTASEALLKSCGFVQEAYFWENYYFRGTFGDSSIFSLIKPIE